MALACGMDPERERAASRPEKRGRPPQGGSGVPRAGFTGGDAAKQIRRLENANSELRRRMRHLENQLERFLVDRERENTRRLAGKCKKPHEELYLLVEALEHRLDTMTRGGGAQ